MAEFKDLSLISFLFQVNNSLTVDAIEFYVTDAFGEGLYNSCKDVKFGTMNTRAIEFVAGGAKDFKGRFLLLLQYMVQFGTMNTCYLLLKFRVTLAQVGNPSSAFES